MKYVVVGAAGISTVACTTGARTGSGSAARSTDSARPAGR
jgi:hypothetical protein